MMRRSRPSSWWGLIAGSVIIACLLCLTLFRSAWAPLLQDSTLPLLNQIQYIFAGWIALKQEWQLYRQEAQNQRAVLSELAQLRKELKAMQIVAAENQRLRKLLQLPIPKTYEKIGAEVIARPPSQWLNRVQINKGFEDGLSLNQAVMNQNGVVGRIAELSAKTAMVELLTDPNSAVSCLTEKMRKPAILSGGFAGENARLKYLENYTRVLPGEKILTSGLGGTFPADLLLGEVVRVEQKQGHPVPEVEVKLSAFQANLQHLIVLVPTS